MDLFNGVISDLQLIDPPMVNQAFTWSNMQSNPTLARLDRFLISTSWDHDFPLSKVEALPRVISNHCPIMLSIDKNLKARKLFRFEDAWLKHDGFVANVHEWWKEVAPGKLVVLNLTVKLRHCRSRIKEWCKKEFYNVKGHKRELMEAIQEIDRSEEDGDLFGEEVARREELKDKLSDVINDEAAIWRTRAKQHWIREGDCNTKFFHSVANGRRRANRIGPVAESRWSINLRRTRRHTSLASLKSYSSR